MLLMLSASLPGGEPSGGGGAGAGGMHGHTNGSAIALESLRLLKAVLTRGAVSCPQHMELRPCSLAHAGGLAASVPRGSR